MTSWSPLDVVAFAMMLVVLKPSTIGKILTRPPQGWTSWAKYEGIFGVVAAPG